MKDSRRRGRHDVAAEAQPTASAGVGSGQPRVSTRLVGGPEVRLINISRGHLLVETESRLAPSSPIALKFVTPEASLVIQGRVVRCTVATVSGSALIYHTAVSFDEGLEFPSWMPLDGERSAGDQGQADGAAAGAPAAAPEATTAAETAQDGAPAAPLEPAPVEADSPDGGVSHVSARDARGGAAVGSARLFPIGLQSDDELLRVLAGNDW